VFDGDLDVWRAYGVTGQPAWAFVDDSGSVRVVLGRLGEQGLTSAIDSLLAT
jgi:hypothetical protein